MHAMMADEAANRKEYFASWRKTIAMWVGAFVSALVLGVVSGWLTGESGPHPTVVAATVPAIISLVGSGLALVAMRSREIAGAVIIFTFIVTFCAIFMVSVKYGVQERRLVAKWSLEVAEKKRMKKREFELETCARMEFRINKGRETLGLALLPPEYFCEVPP